MDIGALSLGPVVKNVTIRTGCASCAPHLHVGSGMLKDEHGMAEGSTVGAAVGLIGTH